VKDIPVSAILVLTLLLLCAGVFSILFKRLRFPYTIGLVLVGLGLGALANHVEGMAFVSRIHFTPNVVLYVLLPTLVFDAALNLDTRLLVKNLFPVMVLAAPGLVLATLLTGLLLGNLTPLSMGAAMLFGALISATDPVAVIAVFKELGAPKRLTMLVDGESLFNDATAIVMFTIVLGLLAGGATLGASTVAMAGVRFVVVFLGGTLLGAFIGYVMVRLLSLANDDPLVEIAFTAVIAYLAFVIAQFYLDLSGVMAVVGAGLVVSYYGSTRFSPAVKAQLRHFWEFACFAANSYIFILLGLTEGYLARDAQSLARAGLYVPAAILAVTLVRAALVYGLVPLLNRCSRQPPVDRASQTVMFWGGLRGALPIALAMSLTPEQVGGELNRTLILDCTLGVVLFTLLVQGTTIGRLMNKLKLNAATPLDDALLRNARSAIRRSGLRSVESVARDWPSLAPLAVDAVRSDYRQAGAADHDAPAPAPPVAEGELWVMALQETRAAWRDLFELGFLSEHAIRELELYLDACRAEIVRGILPPAAIRTPGFEERLAQTLRNFFERAAPNASWTRRLRRTAVRQAYSVAMARAFSAERTLRALPNLQALCDASPDAVERCAAWFRSHGAAADAHMRQLGAEHFAIVSEFQESALRRFARKAEHAHLDELVERGGLPEHLLPMLLTPIPRKRN
jgi:monovalent cation:H+ antiporter, CPA1 family